MHLLTERDVEILRFINEFGFCELKHIMSRFALKESMAYKIMRRLVKHELVVHQRIYHIKPGVYSLSKVGASYTDLPALKNIPTNIYEHQLKIIEVYIALLKQYSDAYWLSERRLFKDLSHKDRVKKKHVADGVLILPDKRQIAIEVELTLKSKSRLKQIFLSYAGEFDINEVWYYCSPNLMSALQKIAENKEYIKVYNLGELLGSDLL